MTAILNIQKIRCKITAHKYVIAETYGGNEVQLRCTNCGKRVFRKENGLVIPYSQKLHKAYQGVNNYREKKKLLHVD